MHALRGPTIFEGGCIHFGGDTAHETLIHVCCCNLISGGTEPLMLAQVPHISIP